MNELDYLEIQEQLLEQLKNENDALKNRIDSLELKILAIKVRLERENRSADGVAGRKAKIINRKR